MIRLALGPGAGGIARPGRRYRHRDHYVPVTSTVPAIAGQTVKLYVRERATPEILKNGAGDKVVLFVHGAGTPAEVSFDRAAARIIPGWAIWPRMAMTSSPSTWRAMAARRGRR